MAVAAIDETKALAANDRLLLEQPVVRVSTPSGCNQPEAATLPATVDEMGDHCQALAATSESN